VRIETNQAYETAIAGLALRTPEALATFIASLAFEAGPIGEHVRTFLIGDDLPALTESLKERIHALRGSHRQHLRHQTHAEVGERIGFILWAIEKLVLPVSPATGFELLVLLIERDGDAMEQCGDDDWAVQMELETAAKLIAVAMKSMSGRDARRTLERLVAQDGYGTRAPLAAVLASTKLRK
jgi:hypothetical protein